MAKQIYIDENGNENIVSGTINNAALLPISESDSTNTKDYIDNSINAPIKASEVNAFTSLVGTTWEEGCYYIKRNGLVIVHISLQGLTANARNDIFTLPTDCKPSYQIVGTGRGGLSYTAFAQASVTTNGQLQISSVDTYAKIHFMYYVDE